jgi:hypothetical protein
VVVVVVVVVVTAVLDDHDLLVMPVHITVMIAADYDPRLFGACRRRKWHCNTDGSKRGKRNNKFTHHISSSYPANAVYRKRAQVRSVP